MNCLASYFSLLIVLNEEPIQDTVLSNIFFILFPIRYCFLIIIMLPLKNLHKYTNAETNYLMGISLKHSVHRSVEMTCLTEFYLGFLGAHYQHHCWVVIYSSEYFNLPILSRLFFSKFRSFVSSANVGTSSCFLLFFCYLLR